MDVRANSSTLKLLLHSLLPSQSSLLIGSTISILIPALHVFFIHNKSQSFAPSGSDAISQAYATNVYAPVQSLLGSSSLVNITTVILWGICGWLAFVLMMWFIQSVSDLRTSEESISYSRASNRVVRHATLKDYVLRGLWRLLLLAVLLAYSAGMVLLSHSLLANDALILHASSLLDAAILAVTSVLFWALMFHGFLILLRFLLGRTRLFGEILT